MSKELEELQELVITEEAENNDLLNELENIDFSECDLDIEKYYSAIEGKERNQNFVKSLEAENIVKTLSPIYLEETCASNINATTKAIEDLLSKYNIEKELIQSLDRSGKDKIFAIVKHFNLKLANTVNNMIFNINLKRDEIKFIINAFRNSISYNGNDILMIGDLKSTLSQLITLDKELPKNVPSVHVNIDIRNIVIMYQFLSKHEVKGMSEQFYTFTNIINKIKDANDLFNAFNIIRERVNSKFLVWAGATNTLDEEINSDTIQGSLQQPTE